MRYSSFDCRCLLFFFNDTATTEIYTLAHSFPTRRSSDLKTPRQAESLDAKHTQSSRRKMRRREVGHRPGRSEEHTSELQSLMRTSYAVFCLKKKTKNQSCTTTHR